MEHSRHQCLIYDGAPSRHLNALSACMRDMLARNYRCLYLNSPTMVTGMRSYLAAGGLNVAECVDKGALVLTSEQMHLEGGVFKVDSMLGALKGAVDAALAAGYKGLWATGDMGWEFGQRKDFTRLLEYERKLEEYFQTQPALCGICQYHIDTLPPDAVQNARRTHRSLFINETLSHMNLQYEPVGGIA